jgi:hypothetical protein
MGALFRAGLSEPPARSRLVGWVAKAGVPPLILVGQTKLGAARARLTRLDPEVMLSLRPPNGAPSEPVVEESEDEVRSSTAPGTKLCGPVNA